MFKSKITNYRFYLFIVSFTLFLFLFPLVNKINFTQNDDWAFKLCVENYLQGNFNVNPITIFNKSAPLFYTQGIMGSLFSLVFGIENLPILTLIISVCNFYILYLILIKFLNKKPVDSILYSLLFFFNPLYFYSMLGFMTENYFLFFLLLSLYFILSFTKNTEGSSKREKTKDFILANIFIILGFFVRQFSFFTSIAFTIYLFFCLFSKEKQIHSKQKDIKNIQQKYFKQEDTYLICQILITVLLAGGYYLFMSGNQFEDSGLNLTKFLDTEYSLSIVIAICIYLVIYFLPLIISFLKDFILNIYKKPIKLFLVGLLALGIYFLALNNFYPNKLYRGEFPYFGNTVLREGFYTKGIQGQKTNFYGMYDLYKYWERLSQILLFSLLLIFLKLKDKLNNFFLIFLVIYIPFLLFNINVYDRYLSVIFLMFILLISSVLHNFKTIDKIIILGFIFFLSILCYQFSMDFVYTRKLVWKDANNLNIDKSLINAGTAWNRTYKVINPVYVYSYDSLDALRTENITLIKTLNIAYPFSFYPNNKVYLYNILK